MLLAPCARVKHPFAIVEPLAVPGRRLALSPAFRYSTYSPTPL